MTRTIRIGTTLLVSVLTALAVALLATADSAGAQDTDATLDVTVRYPNGQLVTDTEICLSYSYVFDGQVSAFDNLPFAGPQSSFPIQSGEAYAVLARSCPTEQLQLVPTYHNGMPTSPAALGSAIDVLLPLDAIYAKPGANEVTITIGASHISGRVEGTFAYACSIRIWGQPVASSYNGPMYYSNVNPDGSYDAFLPPGAYTVETSCFLRSAYEAWPNVEAISDASTITVAHGESRTGIDFDITDRFDETVGASLFIAFADDAMYRLPKCIESYDLNGKLIRRELGFSSAGAPTNGSYRVLIRDCFGMGFNNVWYPNAPTPQAAEIIVVDGTLAEIPLTNAVTLTGPNFSKCGDTEVTIRGSRGNDVIVGSLDADVISAFGGNDIIRGLSGDDVICAGDGNDRVFGNAGDDWIDAGAGADWVGAGWGEDTVYGGAGNDFIRGFKHNDFVDGGTGNDRITGGWGNDVLRGGPGNDTLRAYFGADRLFGDAGNDALVAGNGPDFLVGGPGPADRLFGDQGRDICNDVGVDTQFTDCEKQNEPGPGPTLPPPTRDF